MSISHSLSLRFSSSVSLSLCLCLPLPLPLSRSPSLSHAFSLSLTFSLSVIQNICNGVEFGLKEDYLSPLNPFIRANQARYQEFIANLYGTNEGSGGFGDDEIEQAPQVAQVTLSFRVYLEDYFLFPVISQSPFLTPFFSERIGPSPHRPQKVFLSHTHILSLSLSFSFSPPFSPPLLSLLLSLSLSPLISSSLSLFPHRTFLAFSSPFPSHISLSDRWSHTSLDCDLSSPLTSFKVWKKSS
jgi:hypothetical protein